MLFGRKLRASASKYNYMNLFDLICYELKAWVDEFPLILGR